MSNTTIIALVVGVVFLILMIVLLYIYFSKGTDAAWKKDIEKKLTKYHNLLNRKDSVTLQTVIVNLDKLLDHVMQKKMIKGETMGERLKSAEPLFDKDTYNHTWNAHKLRNRMVHEIDVPVDQKEIRYHSYNLQRAIRKLIS